MATVAAAAATAACARYRQAVAADEDLDGDVIGGDKFASEKSCQSDHHLGDALVQRWIRQCRGCAVTQDMRYSRHSVFERITIIEAHNILK